jgi:NAD(P)H-dependent FMN reductase
LNTVALREDSGIVRAMQVANAVRVLAVSSSLGMKSSTAVVLNAAVEALRTSGAEADVLDLHLEPLPLLNPETAWSAPYYAPLKARVVAADVFLLATPDYHGSMSGSLKNFLDHFWKEFSGKLFVSLVGSHEKGLTVHDQIRTVARQCYAWTLPYGVSFSDKEDLRDGQVVSTALLSRLEMLVRDVRVYGGLLAAQRREDLSGGETTFLSRYRK